MKIGFIGLGNMANAMLDGMLANKIAKPKDIMGSAHTIETREQMRDKHQIRTVEDNRLVAEFADILILAVKPQILNGVLEQIKSCIKEGTVIVSIAAGKTIEQLEAILGTNAKLVRCMPNTPAMVGLGCCGVCRNKRVPDSEMKECLEIFQSFGIAEEVPEKLMDAVVGVSGSSPAFVFMFLEALADGAVKAGMPRSQAYRFAAQTVQGSAKLMLETGKHPGELKDMVCSPGGTTIEGVNTLEDMGFRGAVMDAVEACVEKSRNM